MNLNINWKSFVKPLSAKNVSSAQHNHTQNNRAFLEEIERAVTPYSNI